MSGASHAAPGLVAAIQFQLKRALLHLLTSDADSFVGIKAPWDIGVFGKDGKLLKAEEDKNSIIGLSQLGDRHEGLWKSLRNYTAAFFDGRLSGYGAKLTICTNVKITSGWTADFIVRTWDEADEWVEARAKALLKAGANPSASIKPHVEYFKNHSAEFLRVVRNLVIIEGSAVGKDGKTSQEIYRLLRSKPGEQEYVLEALMGWLGEYAGDHISRGEPALIPVSAFNARYRDELNRGRQLRLLGRLEKDFAEALTPQRKKRHAHDTFQRQLRWVGLHQSPDVLEQAMEDFLKYEVAVTAYAEDGSIDRRQFSDREGDVQGRWRVIFNQECFSLPKDEESKVAAGRQVFHRAALLDVPLEGFGPCEAYFTRGALQHLANAPSDEPRVGWHPEYKALAKQDDGAI